jgi:hypothetical protein
MSTGTKIALSFEVGTQEKHLVEFRFDQFWGGLVVTVDNQSIVRELRIMSISLVKTYELVVGRSEQHHVRIDKTRKLFFPGFRSQVVRAFVDGEFVAQDQSFGPAVITPVSS